MHAKEIERAAYIAAHGILAANTSAPELACPGARRTHAIDVIADIIKEVFELYEPASDPCRERGTRQGPEAVEKRRPALVLEVPRPAGWRSAVAQNATSQNGAAAGD